MNMNFLPTKEAKEIYYDDDARSKLMSGIRKISKAVKSTLGARGRTVLIESKDHIGGVTVTKDGVTVASAINLFFS
jgi:chaperonin GroEL